MHLVDSILITVGVYGVDHWCVCSYVLVCVMVSGGILCLLPGIRFACIAWFWGIESILHYHTLSNAMGCLTAMIQQHRLERCLMRLSYFSYLSYYGIQTVTERFI
jgi:arginine exporter protein ArgO